MSPSPPTLTFTTLPSIILKQITSYLTLQQTLFLSHLSQHFRHTILSQDFLPQYQINQFQPNCQFFINWLSQYHNFVKPKSLILNLNARGSKEGFGSILKVIQETKEYLENLRIKVDTEVQKLNYIVFSKVFQGKMEKLKRLVSNLVMDNEEFGEKIRMIEELEVTNQSLLLTENHICQFPPKARRIFLRPYQINWTALVKYISTNPYIQELYLDCEHCQQQLFPKLINHLNSDTITLLKMQHLENLNSSSLVQLSKLTKLKTFCLLKTFSVDSLAWHQLTKSSTFPYLQHLNLTQAINLEDKPLNQLIDKSPGLKYVNLSWCNKITNCGVGYLIRKCEKLEQLILVGIKELNDNAFEEFVQYKQIFKEDYYTSYKNQIKYKSQKQTVSQFNRDNFFSSIVINPKVLKNIKVIDCQKVNFVSDNLLKVIGVFRRNCKITNYYSNSMVLYHFDDEDDY